MDGWMDGWMLKLPATIPVSPTTGIVFVFLENLLCCYVSWPPAHATLTQDDQQVLWKDGWMDSQDKMTI